MIGIGMGIGHATGQAGSAGGMGPSFPIGPPAHSELVDDNLTDGELIDDNGIDYSLVDD